MATKISGDVEATGTEPSFSTMEYAALRKVLGEHLKSATKSNRHVETIIAEHASNMRELLGSYDYEAINLTAIVRNSTGMDAGELREYLRMIEALSAGYVSLFGKELAFLVVSGMLAKFHNNAVLHLHYVKLREEIEGKVAYYKGKAGAESRIIASFGFSINEMESGIFRIFRKKRIRVARVRMGKSEVRLRNLDSRMKKFAGILENMRNAAEQPNE